MVSDYWSKRRAKEENDKKNKVILIEKYNTEKEKLDNIRSNTTIEKWKILSVAYALGKKIWGRQFTKQQLAADMEIPLSTVLRCLSLDKANSRTWELINTNKITAFKVAQICQSKNFHYQDEVVDLVIKNDVSTHDIKKIKIKNVVDVSKEKHRLACKKGYSRKSSAYDNFSTWIERGHIFMTMDINNLPETKLNQIDKDLNNLNKHITLFLDDLNNKINENLKDNLKGGKNKND